MATLGDKMVASMKANGQANQSSMTLGDKMVARMKQNNQTVDKPWNTRRVLANINNVYSYDQEKAQKMYSDLRYLQSDPTSKYYNPYMQATNKSVAALASYGIDTSVIDDNFFKQNNYLLNYLNRTGTTNSPSKPSAKASDLEKAAYEFYQIWKADEATVKAENEWKNLQDEIKYWVGRTDRNLSDEEILGKIDWDNYSELVSMDKNKQFQPNEYNRAIGYSQDALYGAIWEARNPDFNGTMEEAMANSYLGNGNKYKRNNALSAMLDAGNKETYSPYAVGSTMEKEGLYFGVNSFDDKWIEENRARIMASGDEKAMKYFGNVVEAVEYTKKLNTQLDDMWKAIDTMIASSDRPNADLIINMIKGDSAYKDLFDLDDTMAKGPSYLKNTASSVNYRWSDVEQQIRNQCKEKDDKADAIAFTNLVASVNQAVEEYVSPIIKQSIEHAEGMRKPGEEKAEEEPERPQYNSPRESHENGSVAGKASTGRAGHEHAEELVTKKEQKPTMADVAIFLGKAIVDAYSEIENAVQTYGTEDEKVAMLTDNTSYKDWCIQTMKDRYGDFVSDASEKAIGNLRVNYGTNYGVVRDFENHQTTLKEKQDKLDQVTAELEPLAMKKDSIQIVNGLDEQQTMNLIQYAGLPEGEDEFVDTVRQTLDSGRDGFMTYYDAARYFYTGITGHAPMEGEDYVSKVRYWYNYVKEVKASGAEYDLITPEEEARYEELSRWKKTLENEINDDKTYISANQRSYDQAKKDNDLYRLSYETAAKINKNLDPYLFGKVEMIHDISDTDYKYGYSSKYDYDEKLASGELTREEAAASAYKDATACASLYESMSQTYNDLINSGVQFDEQGKKSIKNYLETIKDYARLSSSASLDGQNDFDSVVADTLANRGYKGGIVEGNVFMLLRNGRMPFGADTTLPEEYRSMTAMNEQEARRYVYLLGKCGEKEADEYLKFLCDPNKGILTVRKMENIHSDAVEFAQGNNGLNAYIAIPLGVASSLFSWASPYTYRIGQALKGEDVSPYNEAFASEVGRSGLYHGSKEAVLNASRQIFGDDSFLVQANQRWLDIGIGAAELSAGSMMASDFLRGFGVDLGNLASGLQAPGLSTKIAKSAAEVAIPTLNSTNEKYRNVLLATGDAVKAGVMADASFISGLITHAVVLNGIHEAAQASPKTLVEAIGNMFHKIVKTDTAVAASTGISALIDKETEKAVMGADSEWQKTVDYLHDELGYSTAEAQQEADGRMWQQINEQIWQAVINATIRTATMSAVNYIGSNAPTAIKNTVQKLKSTWSDVKEFMKNEFSVRDEGPVVKNDLNDMAIPVSELDPSVYEMRPIAYNKERNTIRTDDGRDVRLPEGTQISKYGYTIIVDRENQRPYNSVGYLVDPETKEMYFITDNAEKIPWMNVAANFYNTEVFLDDYTVGREYAYMAEAWDYAISELSKYYADYNTQINMGGIMDVDAGIETATQSRRGLLGLPSNTWGAPGESEQSPIDAKDLQAVISMGSASPANASNVLAATLNTGNNEADKAASNSIIANMSYGDPRVVSMVLLQAFQTHYDADEVKGAIVSAALTGGQGNEALKSMFEKTTSGTPLTSEDVTALITGVKSDMMNDPKGFDDTFNASITASRVAKATNDLVAEKKQVIKDAEANVTRTKETLSDAQQKLDQSNENKLAAQENATEALGRLKESGASEDVAPVQQTQGALKAADAEVRQAEEVVKIQQRKVEEAEEKLQDTTTAVINEARQQAVATVQEQQETETQLSIDEALAKYKPLVEIVVRGDEETADGSNRKALRDENNKVMKKSVRVFDKDGNPVNIIGVYDKTRKNIIYMTDKGGLVSETTNLDHPRVGEVEAITKDRDLAAAVNELESRSDDAGKRKNHPDITPFRYLPSSFPINVNGNEVQIIGIAGKQTFEDHNSPVVRGLDGNLYTLEDPAVEAQLDNYKEHGDIIWDDFFKAEKKLYEIPDEKITHVEEAQPDAEPETDEQQALASVQVPVQGNEGEGDNGGELAGQLGQPVGSGSDSNAELESEEPQTSLGRGEEGESGYNGSPASRNNARLRSIIEERLRPNQSAYDPDLQDETDQGRFYSALTDAVARSTVLPVNSVTPEDLAESKAAIMLSPDGKNGIAVGQEGKNKGKIMTMFSYGAGTDRDAYPYLVLNAIGKGGYKIDTPTTWRNVFDQFGFTPVARVQEEGKPEKILWLSSGRNVNAVSRRYMFTEKDSGYHRQTTDEYNKLRVYDNMEEAEKYRDFMWENRDRRFIITHSIAFDLAVSAAKRGNFIAPSLGITRPGQRSYVYQFGTNHGESPNVTFFFDESVLDKNKNPSIHLLNNDVWSPTFPKTDVEEFDGSFVDKKTGEVVSPDKVAEMQFKDVPFSRTAYSEYESVEDMKNDLDRIVDSDSVAYKSSISHFGKTENALMLLQEEVVKANNIRVDAENLAYRMNPFKLSTALYNIAIDFIDNMCDGDAELATYIFDAYDQANSTFRSWEAFADALITDGEAHKKLEKLVSIYKNNPEDVKKEDWVDLKTTMHEEKFQDEVTHAELQQIWDNDEELYIAVEAFKDKINDTKFLDTIKDVKTDEEMQEAIAGIGFNISKEAAGRFLDAIEDAKGTLADYFEAKDTGNTPMSFSYGALIPKDADPDDLEFLKWKLEELGIKWAYQNDYTNGGRSTQATEFFEQRYAMQKAQEAAEEQPEEPAQKLTGLLNVMDTIKNAQKSDATGLDRVLEEFNLDVEGDDIDRKFLINEDGITFGYKYTDDNGNPRIGLREMFDNPDVLDVLKSAGYTTYDSEQNEWVMETTQDSVNAPTEAVGDIPAATEDEADTIAEAQAAAEEAKAPSEVPAEAYVIPGTGEGANGIVRNMGLTTIKVEGSPSTVLKDFLGDTVAFVKTDDAGNETLTLSPLYDFDSMHDLLDTAGFVWDDDSAEWYYENPTPTTVTEQEPPAEPVENQEPPATPPITPTNVNPPAPPEEPPTPTNVSEPKKEYGQRQWNVKGAQQSEILSDKTKDYLKKHAKYLIDHNSDQIDRSLKWISSHASENDPSGLYGAISEIQSDDFNLYSADGQVRMQTAIAMASAAGDEVAALKLSDELFSKSGTDLGQAMQARKIWMTMTPEGRKASIRRQADKVQQYYENKGKNLRFAEGKTRFDISEELLEEAANADTEEKMDEVWRKLEKEIAAQIPSDFEFALRTYRYFAMLSGPRTHVRNVFGNIMGAVMVGAKNAVGAGLEAAKGLPQNQRTKAIHHDAEAVEYAKSRFPKIKRVLQGQTKFYNATPNNLLGGVESQRKAFGNGKGIISRTLGKGMQKASDAVGAALEAEDLWFLEHHYVNALAGFMTARGLKPKDMKGKVQREADEYAISQAQEATFRSANELTTWFNSLQQKQARWIIDAVQPFLKTPANIVKFGAKYSPVGLLKSVLTGTRQVDKWQKWADNGFKGPKPKGAKSPAEVTDSIAAGLTGTMIAGLGYFLAAMGALKVKTTEAEQRRGSQNYSLEIGGKSIGIGNIVPFNVPLLFGGAVYESLSNNEPITEFKDGDYAGGMLKLFGKGLSVIKDLAQPVVDTTMMSSLNNLLDVNSYSSGDLTLGTLGEKVIANYAASFYPSALTTIAKVVDPVRRKAYVKSGDELSIWTALVEQTVNKMPFLSTMNVPYINAWGEGEDLGYFKAFMQNVILPDKIQDIKQDDLDLFLEKLSNDAATNVEPKNEKTISLNGKNRKLDDKEWSKYNTIRGQESKKMLQKLVETPEFIAFNGYPEIQAELVKKVYKYAKAKAALETFSEKEIKDSWTKGALDAAKKGKLIDYIFEKEEESAKNKSNDQHRDALYNSVVGGNYDAAVTDINYLRRGGVEDKNIRSSLSSRLKPVYKEMYEEGRQDDMYAMQQFLIGLDIGYTSTSFSSWLKN